MIEELRPRLYRWTARHPEWKPSANPGSPDDWPADVGSVAYATGDRLLVVDALVPADDEDGFWMEMDRLVAEHGPRVTTVKTIRFHTRSRTRFVERYGAERPRTAKLGARGVEVIPVPDADETMLWLSGRRALVAGDRLIGDGNGGVRMCPESWLRYIGNGLDLAGLRERLRPLLELPVDLVLVSHGEPVLRDGRAAIARALDA